MRDRLNKTARSHPGATYDRKVSIKDMIGPDGRPYSPDAFKGLEEKFEVRLRPRDGTPVHEIKDVDLSKHILLTDRKTGKQYRVRSEMRAGHAMGIAMAAGDGARPDDVNLDLYEVFEGERFKPTSPGKREFGTDMLNHAWKECWRRPPMKAYRDLFRRAVPFNLDDAATELVTELAMKPERLGLYRQLARLPYEVVWIELNHQAQVAAQLAHGSPREAWKLGEEGRRVGYLIERLTETRWRCTYWAQTDITQANMADWRQIVDDKTLEVGDMAVDTFSIAFIVDTEGTTVGYRTQVTDPSLHHAAQAMADDGNLGGIAWGIASEVDGRHRPSLHPKDFMTATVDLPPDWELGVLKKAARPHERRELMERLMREGTSQLQGLLRHVCATLATINQAPMSVIESAPQTGSFRADGRLRPFKVNRTVAIRVPGRRNTVKKVLKLFTGAKRRMARHQVRGFWRTTQLKERPGERWVWMMSPRYNEYRWHIWVNEFERGDAALGWVSHDYEVTT
jgi:hypothetical protein